ncbi:MAG: DNA gyrase subunit A, partial [Candidatus Woesearchaeota archaeon]
MDEDSSEKIDVQALEDKKNRIFNKLLEDEMKTSYLDYAMSVIVSRALPDVRDGLKPVHRRILYAMNELGITASKPYKKSARIVGEVLGKYHPHGDTAVYDSLVRMAQDFSLRYMLVDGQGNFGSVDGDNAAAMRYTEARMSKIATEMLLDIEKDTVDFALNFDGTEKEPIVLPARIPTLLANGAVGIAVGMATNIPPHNIKELAQATITLIKNPDVEINDLMQTVAGPDFPTGGIIFGTKGIELAYKTGKGKVKVRAKTHFENNGNRLSLIIDEIPYQVNKANLIIEIADKVKDKIIEGISDIRDESDREGMRIVIELKKDVNQDIVLNQLFKHTRLQTTQGINLLCLVDNVPQTLTLKEILEHFVAHRLEVVTRRTQFDLTKSEKQAHLLLGLKVAIENLDKTIAIVRGAPGTKEAKEQLIAAFSLDDVQAQAILDMRLQKLTGLERDKLVNDYNELLQKIEELKTILDSTEKKYSIIVEELQEIASKYEDKRRTEIFETDEEDIDIEDLIEPEDDVITITHAGYIKRIATETYKAQGRGGKGIIATGTKDEDFVEKIFIANTHDYLLCFTNKGEVHW